METIRIPNAATETPISLTDLMVAAPFASRLLLGASMPGLVIQAAAFGAYAGSVLGDWVSRQGIRRIEFLDEFGADVQHLVPMPQDEREREIGRLAKLLNDVYTPSDVTTDELAIEVNEHLTTYISGITGQRVETSSSIRNFTLAQFLMPFAVGMCDVLSGDVAVFQDTGVFQAHIVTHEFCHRKGYFKELEAQALAYLALAGSGDPRMQQSAYAERLYRNLRVLDGEDADRYHELLDGLPLRPEIESDFRKLRPKGATTGPLSDMMKQLYEERMKLTGQNGLSDYDEGFTNFLYTYENGLRPRPVAA